MNHQQYIMMIHIMKFKSFPIQIFKIKFKKSFQSNGQNKASKKIVKELQEKSFLEMKKIKIV